MNKGTITVLGHQVECINETGDTIDGDKLSVAIKEGKKTGILYRPGTGAEIGTWKIVNPEAEKWRSIANKLYNSWVNLTDDTLKEAIQEYKQLIEEENGRL